VHAVEVEYWA